MGDQMTLKMEILARGQRALAELRKVQGEIAKVGHYAVKMAALSKVAFQTVGRAVSWALRPLKWAAVGILGVGASLVALGAKAIGAAGEMETLELRLGAVTKNAEDAQRIFKETSKLAISSPFQMDELVDARIGLLNIGMVGADAIRAVGDASAITQRPLGDLVSMVASLETEPLRRMGIGLKTEGDRFTFEFRDRMQQVQKIVVKGRDNARNALLGIFDVKYGGGMAKFAGAWRGLVSTMQDNLKQAMAGIGQGLLPAAGRFVQAINTKLATALESGKLVEVGQKIGGWLMEAGDWIAAAVEKAGAVFENLRGKGGSAMAEGLRIAFGAGAEILVETLLRGLQAGTEIYLGIGRLIGMALIEPISKLPGMGGVLKSAAWSKIEGMREAGDYAGLVRMGRDVGAMDLAMRTTDPNSGFRGLKDDQLLGIVTWEAGKALEAAFQSTVGTLKGIGQQVVENARGTWGDASAGIAAIAGDTGPSIDERFAARRAGRTTATGGGPETWGEPTRIRYSALLDEMRPNQRGGGQHRYMRRRTFDAGPSDYRMGERLPTGETIIQIENLTVKANDAKALTNEIKRRSGAPLMAAATT